MFSLDLFIIQLYFLIWSIASKLNTFIIGLLLKFLGMIEVFPTNDYQFFQLC